MEGCINHPLEPIMTIRRWQVIFCAGNICAAALLNYFEKWHNYLARKQKQSNSEEPLVQWITKGYLEKNLMFFKRSAITEALQFLENRLVIEKMEEVLNPTQYTDYYIFQPDVVQFWLDNTYEKIAEPRRNEELLHMLKKDFR